MAGNFLGLRKRGVGWEFFDPPQEGFCGNFLGFRKRGFLVGVVCVGNCVVCVLSVFVVGGLCGRWVGVVWVLLSGLWGYYFCGRWVGFWVINIFFVWVLFCGSSCVVANDSHFYCPCWV